MPRWVRTLAVVAITFAILATVASCNDDDHVPAIPDSMRSTFAFSSSRSGTGDIFSITADGLLLRHLTEGPDWDSEPSWSPVDQRVSFVRGYRSDEDNAVSDIYVIDVDDPNPKNLTNDSRYRYESPTWSPDGTMIAFLSSTDDAPHDWWESLFVITSDGSNLRRLTDPAVPVEAAFSWSPDSARIAFSAEGTVWTVNVDGTGLTALSDGFNPAWSPSDDRIALFSSLGGSSYAEWGFDATLSVIDLDSSNRNDLAKVRAEGYPMSWSPDGRQIAFSHAPNGYAQIHVIGFNGSGLKALTDSGGTRHDIAPRWSPDGTLIAFAQLDLWLNWGDLWVVHLDDGRVTNVTNHTGTDADPTWQVIRPRAR
jgi:Tol biopolymer transport system component